VNCSLTLQDTNSAFELLKALQTGRQVKRETEVFSRGFYMVAKKIADKLNLNYASTKPLGEKE
jgi:hypothetical protein